MIRTVRQPNASHLGASPTPYGRSDVEESFAESCALYKADPAALRRINPELADWFAAGGHLKALRDALGEALTPRSPPPTQQSASQVSLR